MSRAVSRTCSLNESEVLLNKNSHSATVVDAPVSLSSDDSRYADCTVLDCASCPSSIVDSASTVSDTDSLLNKAYGASLIHSDGGPRDSPWCQRWSIVVQHLGRHYVLPNGSVGRRYIDMLTVELQHLASGTYAAERVIVFSSVMLQRDRMVRKGCDIRRLLDRRLSLWQNEQYDVLLQEAARCDQSLRNSYRSASCTSRDHLVRVFTKLMLEGNVRAAVRWLTERAGGGVLAFSDRTELTIPGSGKTSMSVLDALHYKHPNPVDPPTSILPSLDNLPQFEDLDITSAHIQSVARQLQGGAGPGGCDAVHWRDILLRYGNSSVQLCDSVAAICRRLCNSLTPWDNIRALVASRLIALDKCPGVRPIGIGETLRRIIGKTICQVTRLDAALVCGSDQLCAGLQAGIEGAIHAMTSLYDTNHAQPSGWGVLMVDASNAFNCLNRAAMLLHARVLWPRCARFLFNTYRGWSVLVMRGCSEFLYSKEGVTQGDPLSMFMYAIGTLPLIRSLYNPTCWTQIWYADDASAGGSLADLYKWFSRLCDYGPAYGYFPEPTKCVLVVDECCKDRAVDMFCPLGVQVVTGHRYLGGFIGSNDGLQRFISEKVHKWVNHVKLFADIASTQPQLAYAAFTRSLQHEWIFLLRVLPQCHNVFQDLEFVIGTNFLPALFGVEVSSAERDLFALPLRMGGLGVTNPVAVAPYVSDLSVCSTTKLVKSIMYSITFELDAHIETVIHAKAHHRQLMSNVFAESFDDLLSTFDTSRQRAILRAKEFNLSSWLAVMPIERDQFDLSAQEFRDGLALRYRKPLLGLPHTCDGCGAPFTVTHALDCRVGGLVCRRHNEVRDAFGDLSSLVWSQVKREPIVCESSDSAGSTLVADLCVRGVWQPQCEAIFDIRVVDTDAPSYCRQSPRSVLSSAESEKKKKYMKACQDRRACFTPLCVSIDGMLGVETEFFLKRLGDYLAVKWERPFSVIMCWIRARLSFAILRATMLCVRGSRTKWRSLGIIDGASLSLTMD